MNVSYDIVPGPASLSIYVKTAIEVRELWNVIAAIEGSKYPEETIVLGNHGDAWVFGAADPNSGTATMLEVARSFGQLLKSGWKPDRTIVLCSWDGEEHGLLGSTNFGESHAAALLKNVGQANSLFNIHLFSSGHCLSQCRHCSFRN